MLAQVRPLADKLALGWKLGACVLGMLKVGLFAGLTAYMLDSPP